MVIERLSSNETFSHPSMILNTHMNPTHAGILGWTGLPCSRTVGHTIKHSLGYTVFGEESLAGKRQFRGGNDTDNTMEGWFT